MRQDYVQFRYVLRTVLGVVQVRVTYSIRCSSGTCYVQDYVQLVQVRVTYRITCSKFRYVLRTGLRVVQVRVTYRVTCSSGTCYLQGYVQFRYVLRTVLGVVSSGTCYVQGSGLRVVQVRVTYRVTCSSGTCYAQYNMYVLRTVLRVVSSGTCYVQYYSQYRYATFPFGILPVFRQSQDRRYWEGRLYNEVMDPFPEKKVRVKDNRITIALKRDIIALVGTVINPAYREP